MKHAIFIAMLAACGDNECADVGPDAGVSADAAQPEASDASCSAKVTKPTLGIGGLCYSTVTIDVRCNPRIAQTYNAAIVGWARLFEAPTGLGEADAVYRCNASFQAVFSVPCADWVGGGAALQDPQLGGDLWAQIGTDTPTSPPIITCDALSTEIP